jgi:hypothetical protein
MTNIIMQYALFESSNLNKEHYTIKTQKITERMQKDR